MTAALQGALKTPHRTLILGGARSGKSAHAEQLALACGKELIYIATAQAHDADFFVDARPIPGGGRGVTLKTSGDYDSLLLLQPRA